MVEHNERANNVIPVDFGLSDRKLAVALSVTRQTVRNWRTGRCFPEFAQKSIRWLVELRRLDPANENLPESLRNKVES